MTLSLFVSQNFGLLCVGIGLVVSSIVVHGWGKCESIITSYDCFAITSRPGEILVKACLIGSVVFLILCLIVEFAACCLLELRSNLCFNASQLILASVVVVSLLTGVVMSTHLLGDLYSYMIVIIGCGFVLQGFVNYITMITLERAPKSS